MKSELLVILLLYTPPLTFGLVGDARLRVGFYSKSCPRAESIVRSVVQNRFRKDPSVTAALLRMHFHDCFVRGCDASILVRSTKKQPSERAAVPNLTVRGFNIIDQAKKKLEAACPSVVSCADIIALATRDAVVLAGGLNYPVPTGRRDGTVSRVTDVTLPGPSLPVHLAHEAFVSKGLTLDDMVVLLGSHTVGVAHCNFFRERLTNFRGTGSPDPTMDHVLRAKLARTCGSAPAAVVAREPTAFLDQNTSFRLDNRYYKQIMANKGVMLIDQALALDQETAKIVAQCASDEKTFLEKFADALVKLGRIEVLTGNAGEIRKKCSVVNSGAKAH